jgi:hypothetical protein
MSILDEARRADPGSFLPEEKLRELEKVDHLMAARVRAARSAEQFEQPILRQVIEPILKKFDFSKANAHRDKCYRDVGLVYRYCVFAMLSDDMKMLEDKLLFWLRTILQSQNFPQGNESIRATYTLLLREAERQIPPEHFRLLDPYLARAAAILPS